jgi:hypothetical protein
MNSNETDKYPRNKIEASTSNSVFVLDQNNENKYLKSINVVVTETRLHSHRFYKKFLVWAFLFDFTSHQHNLGYIMYSDFRLTSDVTTKNNTRGRNTSSACAKR